MTTEQLNAAANFLAANGIEVTKDLVFGMCIKALVDAGFSVPEATDAVLGEGRYAMIEQSVLAQLG